MVRRLGVTLLCVLLAFLVLGVQPAPSGISTDPAAQRALDSITDGPFDSAHPTATFPADYAAVMGYRPEVTHAPGGATVLIKPTGECSAFSGASDYDFDWVCKEHDLAYDVLRYSERIGRPLPPSSREQADAMFRRELHLNCMLRPITGLDAAICHLWAESFAVAVEVNSWRQGYRPPRVGEPAPYWLALAVVFYLVRRRIDVGAAVGQPRRTA